MLLHREENNARMLSSKGPCFLLATDGVDVDARPAADVARNSLFDASYNTKWKKTSAAKEIITTRTYQR